MVGLLEGDANFVIGFNYSDLNPRVQA